MNYTIPKAKKCKVCRAAFMPRQSFVNWCSVDCASKLAVQKLEKAKRTAKATDKRETKARLDAIEKKPVLVKRAQTAFNKFIRARDAGKPCISCGKPLQIGGLGGGFDCGHYRSVGSAVHMRFAEDNAHGQCKHCNLHLAGNHVAYRFGMIDRIGLSRLDQIERDNTLRKYTLEGLIELARYYNAEAKRLIRSA